MMGKSLVPSLIGAGALALGAAVAVGLVMYRRAPVEASQDTQKEASIRVEAFRPEREDVPVFLSGYGEVRPVRCASIAAEVSGTVVVMPPEIVSGALVDEGALLFSMDRRPYEARAKDAEGQVGQAENALRALELELEGAKLRVATLNRATALATASVDRARQQVREGIGSQSELDKADEAMVAAQASEQLAEKELDVFPYRVAEAENRLASARELLRLAELDLSHCEVRAPFRGRVQEVDAERGQYLVPGQSALTLADDSALEISVSLDGKECQRWLRRAEVRTDARAWFSSIEQVACTIYWTEDENASGWTGVLDRVEAFDPASRTLTVAVRVAPSAGEQDAFPLVEGMFCRVSIPGKPLEDVFRMPAIAVSFEDTIYVVEDGRLRTRPIEVVRRSDEYVYVASGIEPSDLVIATRLVDPLDNTLCEVTTVSANAARPE